MKELKDNKTGLIWLMPEIEGYDSDNPIFTFEDASLIKDFTKELNEHNSKQIEKYITGGCAQLGSFMLWAAFDKRNVCYCFEDGKLVASAVITPNSSLRNKPMLKKYIEYYKQNPSLFEKMTDFISINKAQRAISRAKSNNNADIDYLVVIPPEQGRGLGTRAISSIVNNTQFFAPKTRVKSLLTQIHTRNIASQKAFKRNGFEKCPLKDTEGRTNIDDYLNTL